MPTDPIISLRPIDPNQEELGVIYSSVIKSILHGYNPFMPNAGIFAGGYQGPLYPSPTTLILPSQGFDPYQFANLMMSQYQMKSTGDIYEGLGKGNPGNNYLNFGHL